ncbi:MAG: hypothetical protein KDD38_08535 [Bdellovibrionales bacterium]|nr:hypothetical protein [Bdellovibrionales bacterium]
MRDQINSMFFATFFVSLVILLGDSTVAGAQEINPCEDNIIRVNEYRIQTMQSRRGEQECFIYLSQSNSVDDMYKRLIWNSNGEFVVFYSFGKGSANTQTGAKNYYFLPQSQSLKLEIIGADVIQVTTANGVEMRFNTVSGVFEDISGVQFTQNINFNRSSPNWIQLIGSQSFIFESEFKIGSSPKEYQFGQVNMIKSGYTCNANNQNLFSYSSEEPSLKIKTQEQLNALVQQRCVYTF